MSFRFLTLFLSLLFLSQAAYSQELEATLAFIEGDVKVDGKKASNGQKLN